MILSLAFCAGLDLRIGFAAGDPEPAGGVEVHLDRLGQQRIGGEEVDLEAVGDLKRLALDLRIGIGHLGVALGTEGRHADEENSDSEREVLHGGT